jgi:hypothetical protein
MSGLYYKASTAPINSITAINFVLPSNLNTECEFKFSKNSRRTDYLFAIYWTRQINTNTDKPIDIQIKPNINEY